jgi:hypothetical protein
MAPTGDMVAIPVTVSGKAQPTSCSGPLPVRTSAPVKMPLHVESQTPSPRCAPPIRGIEHRAAAAQTRRRLLEAAWHCTTRPVVGGALKRIATPQVYPVGGDARAAAVGTTMGAAKGRALRVSLAVGFRIPDWKLRPELFRGPAAAAMIWPGPRSLRPESFRTAAEATAAGLPATAMVSTPEMRIPASPPPVVMAVFHWPEVKGISLNSSKPEVLHRSAFVPFTTNEEYAPKERSYEYRN